MTDTVEKVSRKETVELEFETVERVSELGTGVRRMRSAYATCVLVTNRWRRMFISRSFPERHYFSQISI
jgi:hypothetical protein